jgi:sugar phosphate permease
VIHRSDEWGSAPSATTTPTLSSATTLIATVLLAPSAMTELTLSLSVKAALLSLAGVLRPGILLVAGLTAASATATAAATTITGGTGWAGLA